MLTRKTADEGTELLVLASSVEARHEATDATGRLGGLRSGEAGSALLDIVSGKVGRQAGVKAGLEEREEEVEDVDAEAVWRG